MRLDPLTATLRHGQLPLSAIGEKEGVYQLNDVYTGNALSCCLYMVIDTLCCCIGARPPDRGIRLLASKLGSSCRQGEQRGRRHPAL